jgi:hypothetical protein
MKAIEIKSQTDKTGRLKLDYKLDKAEKKVRILILFDENPNEDDEKKLWMNSVSTNPAFEYLKDTDEDIYTVNDGEPFND